MSMRTFQMGINKAKKAVELDNNGEYREADKLYLETIDILMEFAKVTRNVKLRTICLDRVAQYTIRIKEIRGIPREVYVTSSPKSGTGSSGAPTKPTKKIATKEDMELRRTVSETIVTEKPDVKWEDVANLEAPKQALREAIILPMLRPDLFKGSRRPWKGILLYGPPGCGKTLIAKAVAHECDATFFNADAASLVSKWLGESEKLVKELFDLARENSPSLIFIDEIDSIATSRGETGEHGGERRIKTQLLQEVDGLKSEDQGIVILGATNRPWEIDSAFRRRFEKRIYVGMPEYEARVVIFKLHTQGVEMNIDVNFEKLAKQTEKFSGSDIALICRESIMKPIRELDISGNLIETENPRPVRQKDFIETLEYIKSSVAKDELNKYIEWGNEFGAI
ncbi:MAG: ATP-binding protein [Candidatus Helarchaeota archaeon]|nr:ATP-binding protein [Candidatus Helarchaeota archaeon]